MKVRVIETVDGDGCRCFKVQKRRLWWWSTLHTFPPVGEVAAMRIAELLTKPRVLFDSRDVMGEQP